MIVEAARSVLAEKGLAATGAREVAAAAGISLGMLTYHFASLDELLMQVLRSEMESFDERRSERMRAAPSGLEGVLTFLGVYLDEDVQPRSIWRIWLDFWARAPHNEEVRQWQVTRYHHVYEILETLIAEGISTGEFLAVDPRDCAREFMALVDGLGEQLVIDEGVTFAYCCGILEGAIRRRLAKLPAPPQGRPLVAQPAAGAITGQGAAFSRAAPTSKTGASR
jgi:AcrR family transcriptional regulator